MEVIHTSIAQKKEILLDGTPTLTGIFKVPQEQGIAVSSEGVVNDHVIDRRYHGGTYKACYLFGKNNYYPYESAFPGAPWQPAMFGENITLTVLDEDHLMVGDTYQLGQALVKIAEPRLPCSKLAHKFEDKSVLAFFTGQQHCGVYVQVITPGLVQPGDKMTLISPSGSGVSITDLFKAFTGKIKNKQQLQLWAKNAFVSPDNQADLRKKI